MVNGDGQPDLVFQNGTNIGVLQVSTSGVPTAWNGVGALSAGWTLGESMDGNGDGQTDLIFQNGTSIGALTVNTSFCPKPGMASARWAAASSCPATIDYRDHAAIVRV